MEPVVLLTEPLSHSLKDEKFTDYNEESTDGRYSSFSTGVGTGYVFLPGDNVLVDGETESMTEKWGFAPSYAITAVMKHSENGKVLGGMTQEQNPATGEMQYCPFFLILDEPLVEISAVEKVEGEISKVGISAEPGMIRVFGASEVAVYDPQRSPCGQFRSQHGGSRHIRGEGRWRHPQGRCEINTDNFIFPS